jgi:putative ABC transport system substrate-binding protein
MQAILLAFHHARFHYHGAFRMQRRDFLTGLGCTATAWPFAGHTQPADKVWRIGIIATTQARSNMFAGFLQGMRDLGYAEGKDFVVEFASLEGQLARLPEAAAELVLRNCDLLLATSTPPTRALAQATGTIPIVFVGLTDPVGNGIVASLARPGGNVTGLASSYDDTSPKQLELLATMVPGVSRIGLLWDSRNLGSAAQIKPTQDAAVKAGLSLIPVQARNLQEIETAFAAFGGDRVQAVMVTANFAYLPLREQIARLALSLGMPTIFTQRDYAEAGGLMSYGQDTKELYRQAAQYVHRLMHGAKPADLPVQRPRRFQLVINRKTANALGLPVPRLLYMFADELIE